jgi:hypothetical protein
MLAANRRASRLSHVASLEGYSKPTPGPLILNVLDGVTVV